jgi:signal transduction histidine kinase/CheY-like chemotaxis protein
MSPRAPAEPFLVRLRRMVVSDQPPPAAPATADSTTALLDALACGVVVHDARGAIVYANRAAERFLGASADRLRARLPLGKLWVAVDDDGRPVPEAQSPAMAALRTGKPVAGRLLGFGGADDRRWAQVDATPELDADGHVVRVVVTLADARQQHDMARQIAKLAQLERLRQLGEMAGGAAHDVNQTLALIAGHADLGLRMLEEIPDVPIGLRVALQTIAQAAMDGGETIHRLQTFGRPDPDKRIETLDVEPLLQHAALVTQPKWRDRPALEGRPIHLTLETDGSPAVRGVASELTEVLTNLIFNAVDAMPRGGTIALAAVRHGPWVELSVTDEGVGIPPEVQRHVFEPFFTTKGERGTGLGLAQVVAIVERHGGRVSFTTSERLGTTFRVRLPAADPPNPDLGRPRTSVPDGAAAAPPGGRRVLVVDDEPVGLAETMLARAGHRVSGATSAEAALARLAAEPFDVVVTDLSLGDGMDGWELAKAVRARHPHVRLALATGWGAGVDRAKAAADGIAAVLSKPYRLDELRAAVDGPADPS